MRPAGGPRPMHPTSRRPGMEPAVAPPPPDQQRRPGSNRGRPQRDRSAEPEEKILRPSTRRQTPSGPPPVSREITVTEGITVKELSEKLDVKASMVIKKLMDRNILASINQTLDSKLATEMAREFGASTNTITYEEESQQKVEVAEEQKDLLKRAPVVTIMGHVDHGKTSLLDAIREANVAGKEAGGITQHIGAYYVEKDGRKIVFIDTPGHEAFTRMRARGAKVTDIVVLVVAADDGVMPQTLEAIDHARAAKVPIVVAINKIDKPDAQPERIKQQLSDRNLLAEDWGGDTVMVPVSAKMKINLDLLLEMILLVADLQDLKANPARPAMGNVLEAKLDRGRGPVATVLVRNGTLHVGDYFICGAVFGKVRAMLNDRGEQIREAEPSTPVEVLGLESMPEAGDDFQVVTDTAKAKQIVLFREAKVREATLAKSSRITLEMLHKKLAAGEVTELPIILKADVGGSAEVLTDTLQKLSNDKVKIRVLRSGVGAINESDVLLASASDAIIIGFNVRPERNTSALAEQEKVDIRLHTIIYNLTDEIKRAMTGLLEPVFKEVYKGKAQVRDTFRITKVGNVAGCQVQDGAITRESEVRLLRDNVVVYTGGSGHQPFLRSRRGRRNRGGCRRLIVGLGHRQFLRSRRGCPNRRKCRRRVAGWLQEPFLRSLRPPPMQVVVETGGEATGPEERPPSTREQDGRDHRHAPQSVRETTSGHRPCHEGEAHDRDRQHGEQHPHGPRRNRHVNEALCGEQRDDHQADGAQALGPSRTAKEQPP